MKTSDKHLAKYLKIALGFIAFVLLSSSKCSEDIDYEEFNNLLERANLIFYEPKEYQFVPIIENKQVHYDIAYILKNGIEVRYCIYPYDSLLIKYNAYLDRKAKGINPVDSIKGEYREAKVDPNNIYKTFFVTYLFNASEKTDSTMNKILNSYQEFPKEAVEKEFGADYGAHVYIKLDPEFGQKYFASTVFMIHRKDCGMIVCFRLFKDRLHLDKLFKEKSINSDFYNLKFYNPPAPYDLHPKNMRRIIWNDEY